MWAVSQGVTGAHQALLPPAPPHTFPTCLDFVSPIPFPSPLPPTHTGCPSSAEVGGPGVEATAVGRTQAWQPET